MGKLINGMSIAGTICAVASPVSAIENYIMESLPPHLEARIQQQSSQLLLGQINSADDFFISNLKLWDTNQPIRVCFFGGSSSLRSRIATIASAWQNVGGFVPLDFGDINNPRTCAQNERNSIRIGFQYKGYWSMVGTDSINLVAQYEQSMNFGLFNIAPPLEPEFTRVVLHEFGHALGFQHEHQSYQSPCSNEFNWDTVYSYLQGPPNYWDKPKIDHNLRPRGTNTGQASDFDVESIMLYSFPVEFYKTGTDARCFTQGNAKISSLDAEAVKKFYSNDHAFSTNLRQRNLQAYYSAVEKSSAPQFAKSLAKISATNLVANPDGGMMGFEFPASSQMAARNNNWWNSPAQNQLMMKAPGSIPQGYFSLK